VVFHFVTLGLALDQAWDGHTGIVNQSIDVVVASANFFICRFN
jgi:hypothetical protein